MLPYQGCSAVRRCHRELERRAALEVIELCLQLDHLQPGLVPLRPGLRLRRLRRRRLGRAGRRLRLHPLRARLRARYPGVHRVLRRLFLGTRLIALEAHLGELFAQQLRRHRLLGLGLGLGLGSGSGLG